MKAGEQIAVSTYRRSFYGRELEKEKRLQSGNQQHCSSLEAMAFTHAVNLENAIH